jgi:hypothetical protein
MLLHRIGNPILIYAVTIEDMVSSKMPSQTQTDKQTHYHS